MKSPVFYAIPFFFLFLGLEALFSFFKKKQWYRLNDTLTNISLGIGSQIFGAATKFMLLGIFVLIHEKFAILEIPATWWSFLLCAITFDFLFYWAHRLSHEVNFFWGAHVVHHQSEEYNLSVALRQSWIQNLISFFIFLPIPLLGFNPLTFGAAAGFDTLYQFWIHTKTIGKMPRWVEYIFNTPSHHRVHHAVNPKYIDKNHAGVLIVWDRLFGTFKEEDKDEEIVYGITTPLKSWNPIWANSHYYIQLWQTAKQMSNWRDKLYLIVAKPGWLPEYLGGFQAPPEPPKNRERYDVDTYPWMRTYALLQFAFTLVGGITYLGFFTHISLFYKVIFFAIILLSITIIGAIFEEKKWVRLAECVRLFLVVVSLNSFYYYWYQHWLPVVAIVSTILFLASVVVVALGAFSKKLLEPSTN